MKYDEIIKLLDAGYTRDEILNMDTKAPEEVPPEETAPAETPETAFSDMLGEMRAAFEEMRKEFTAFNIMNSNQPAEEKRTNEDIIAKIINPEIKKGV